MFSTRRRCCGTTALGFVPALAIASAIALVAAEPAVAANITSVSPQGEVAQVRQVTVKFSEAVVPLGDLRQADPLMMNCEGAAPKGAGRWVNERVWVYDFSDNLAPGVRCSLKLRAEWAPLKAPLTGRTEFSFTTGGPAVTTMQPWDRSVIEEDQHFLLQLSGAAVQSSVLANSWCEVDGIGERLPVRIITGPARDELLKARRLSRQAERVLVLTCSRPLPFEAAMRFVWGKGIAAAANPGIVTRVEQRFRFQVRKPFTAEFSCERERAGAPCWPVLAMTLRFSAPISRGDAEKIRLRELPGTAAPAAAASAQQAPAGTAVAGVAPVFEKRAEPAEEVQSVTFARPLPENATLQIELPANLKDSAGRPLANASMFPLAVKTGSAPPIAKFAAAPFGVIEHSAEAMLPVTLRHVQDELRSASNNGTVRVLTLQTDADILSWYTQLLALDGNLAQRSRSLLKERADARRLDLPQLQGGDPRPFEVVGIPLPQAGYHVVEIESRRLGETLLDPKAPMFVRTGVLVTNLGVHFKTGRENALVWVTTLDKARPVEGADVAISDCKGARLWEGRTDAQGLARVPKRLEPPGNCARDAEGEAESAGLFFVSARKADAQGSVDTAFVFSDWQKGIEPWRFNLPTASAREDSARAHSVFDRSLLRAGETVAMKHFLRFETSAGLRLASKNELPLQVKIVHQGSGQEVSQPLVWNGTRSATSAWNIPAGAKLGVYEVVLERGDAANEAQRRRWTSGTFRVEEFRVPLVDARLSGPKERTVAPRELQIDAQLNYLSGGGMAAAPMRASALLKSRALAFPGYEDFSFEPPRAAGAGSEASEGDDESRSDGRLVLDKLPLVSDKAGAARFNIKDLPKIERASELLAELSFNDPNGEVQTASTRVNLWPASVVPGIQAQSWASTRGKARFKALALGTDGQPLKGQKLDVIARSHQVSSHRKRLVGGFYAYDNRTETKELGSVCSGSTDARGLLECEATLQTPGQVELVVQAGDTQGNVARAAASVWVTGQGELWFAQDNDDRIDLLPEKKRYEPGETARLQVRMPFRQATALLSIEREGIISTRVVELRGDDPTVTLKIEPGWGPNVYVSLLALRGRVRDVPWYSFFTWGWKEPLSWVRSFRYDGREYQAPTALVDLAKPAFKLGVAALKIGIAEHELRVSVSTDQAQYGVRQTAKARIKVSHGGRPVQGAEIAFAAVDEGLLALSPNGSWDLLNALIQQRAWGVETSTGQSEIIGRRHYGRKALPAGGGGGRGATRELFDTLLLWRAQVALDANGEATIDVPLNDSLTSFRLVAVADAGTQQFGQGSTSIRVTQDLQLLAGLPPLVREGDRFDALLTLRNTTNREMKLRATLNGVVNSAAPGADTMARAPLALPARELTLAAGAATELSWSVHVPADVFSVRWEASAEEQGGGAPARDGLKFTQLVGSAVPVRVLQATLQQLDGAIRLPVAAPADALPDGGPKRGGVQVSLQPRLSGALPGLRRFFETYPFTCLEQKTSKAIGLRDAAMWAALTNALPTYLDTDGLASYFPQRAGDAANGSDRLTAYLIAAAHEAGFELPAQSSDAMLKGLTAFVEGRIERRFWSPRADLDVRKLAAIEALSRHGQAQARQLGAINLTPNLWPTAALIDWLQVLRRVSGVPDQARRLDEAQQLLRGRLNYAGTTLKFSTEQDDAWWWLMDSADANAARLVLAQLDDPAWRDELPRLVVGALARQRGGAWGTTTANLWGSLALDKFAARFESERISGQTRFDLGEKSLSVAWAGAEQGSSNRLPWPTGAGTLTASHEGSGKPWLSVQSLAAVPLKAPLRAGYAVTRSVTPVEQKLAGQWSRGDIARVRLDVDAQSDMSWVVVSDPVPAGATLLGSGLGRDSALATRGEKREGRAWPVYEERSAEAFRSYFDHLPKGRHVVEYTVRFSNTGRFSLPPSRVEAMYAPESFGESPNMPLEVRP